VRPEVVGKIRWINGHPFQLRLGEWKGAHPIFLFFYLDQPGPSLSRLRLGCNHGHGSVHVYFDGLVVGDTILSIKNSADVEQ
jgi:hypothetical protein